MKYILIEEGTAEDWFEANERPTHTNCVVIQSSLVTFRRRIFCKVKILQTWLNHKNFKL